MKKKIMSLVAVLVLGALTLATQAAPVTVLSENFESYTNGTTLAIPDWLAQATNVTAVVTNNGSSLVGDFSGYALEVGGTGWDHNANLIGLVMTNLTVSGNISPFLADYNLELDLEKLAGPVSWSTEVWLTAGGASTKYVFADPTLGYGPQHYSINLKEYAEANGTFPIGSTTNMQIAVQYYGPSGTNVPDSVYTEYQVDNIQLVMNPAPFYLGAHSPIGANVGLDQTISASAIDLGTEVNTILFWLDGALVDGASSYTGGSATNTFTYGVSNLTAGAHSVQVDVLDTTSLTNRSYQWGFYVAPDGPTIPVGFEGFESYPTGTWNAATAPYANPSPYLNGGSVSPTIVDVGGSNQMLQLEMNLDNAWQVGMNYNIGLNGENQSADPNDYNAQFYMHITNGLSYVSGSFFTMSIYDANDSTKGSQYVISSNDFGYATASAGGVISIPLGSGTLASGASKKLDASASEWRILFRIDTTATAGSKPITMLIDDMVANYIKPPFMNETWSPKGVTTQDPTVSATVYDGTEEVDSMMLMINGIAVTNGSYAGGTTTNTISYDWIGAPSGVHTGTVIAVAASLYAETNSWTFTVPVPPPDPSSNPFELYNINFEGSSVDVGGGLWPVTNGTIAAAPSVGLNNWLNVDYGNPWYFGWQSKSVPESGSGITQITYEMLETSPNIGLYIPWTWGNGQQAFTDASSNTIWSTALGGYPANMNFELRGLNTSAQYDLYLYFVCPTETGETTTTFEITSGIAPYPEAILTSSQASLLGGGSTNWANYVEGETYVVITGIAPDATGKIGFTASGNPGGLSALQLAKRGIDFDVPTPQISSFAMDESSVIFNLEGLTNVVHYTLLSTTNLMDGTWTTVTNGLSSTNSVMWMEIPLTLADEEFFKIEVNP